MLLKPIEMNKALMNELEGLDLIRSITPKAQTGVEPVTTIYRTDGQYGGHKLIHVRIDRVFVTEMISHPEGEDFMLIGANESKNLYLLVAKHKGHDFLEKLKSKSLTPEDYYLINCKFNDENLSFFTMNEGTWHNELRAVGGEISPSFYVGESSDLPEVKVAIEKLTIVKERMI